MDRKRGAKEFTKLAGKHGMKKATSVTALFMADDMRTRYEYASTTAEDDAGCEPKKKRRTGQSWVQWAGGCSEEFHVFVMEEIQLPERERLFLKFPGYDSTCMPFIPAVPLPSLGAVCDGQYPSSLRPLVTPDVKKQILQSVFEVSLLGDGVPIQVAAPAISNTGEKVLLAAALMFDSVLMCHVWKPQRFMSNRI
jgi:hypothetical protein